MKERAHCLPHQRHFSSIPTPGWGIIPGKHMQLIWLPLPDMGRRGVWKTTQPPRKHWRSLQSSPQKMLHARGRAPHADLLVGCKMGCPGSSHLSAAPGPIVGHKGYLFLWDFCCFS